MTAVVFPVGHYLGMFRSGPDDLSGGVELRIGRRTVALRTQAELAAWTLAHDRPTESYQVALTGLVGDAAAELAGTLERRGVIVSVDPDRQAGEFARRYRLRPLQSALGRTVVDDEDGFALGSGGELEAVVDPLLRELWWWAGPSRDLWTLSQRVATSAGRQPAEVLGHFLAHGHELLVAAVAYLDTVIDPEPTTGPDPR